MDSSHIYELVDKRGLSDETQACLSLAQILFSLKLNSRCHSDITTCLNPYTLCYKTKLVFHIQLMKNQET